METRPKSMFNRSSFHPHNSVTHSLYARITLKLCQSGPLCLTIDLYGGLVVAQSVFPLAHIFPIVVGLHVDDGELVPHLGDGQRLTMVQQGVDDMLVIINDHVQSCVANTLVPLEVRERITCKVAHCNEYAMLQTEKCVVFNFSCVICI